jgi:hypothetical protein
MLSLPLCIKTGGNYSIIHVKNPDGSEPISTNYDKFIHNGGKMLPGDKFVPSGSASDPISVTCMAIVYEHIQKDGGGVYFLSHSREQKMVVVGTTCTKCPINELLTGNPRHKSNHIYFTVVYRPCNRYMILHCKDDDCAGQKVFKYPIPDHWIGEILNNIEADEEKIDERDLIASINQLIEFLPNFL